eukprot:ANDGO_07507.mRNA.1 Cullin-3
MASSRLVIKDLVLKPADPQAFVELTWPELASVIDAVFSQQTGSLLYQKSYHAAYRLFILISDPPKRVGLYRRLEERIRNNLPVFYNSIAAEPDETFLTTLVLKWRLMNAAARSVANIFLYWDKHLVEMGHPGPYATALLLIRDEVVLKEKVMPRIVRLVLDKVDAYRSGALLLDQAVIHDAVRMMLELGEVPVYVGKFEPCLLQSATLYFRKIVAESLMLLASPDYLKLVQRIMASELKLVDEVFCARLTRQKIQSVAQEILISEAAQVIVDKESTGATALFRDARWEDLRLMYHMLGEVGEAPLSILRSAVVSFVDQHLGSIVKQAHSAASAGTGTNARSKVEVVEQVLDLRRMVDAACDQCFYTLTGVKRVPDSSFVQAFNKKFEAHLNGQTPDFPELLAEFVDHILKTNAANDDVIMTDVSSSSHFDGNNDANHGRASSSNSVGSGVSSALSSVSGLVAVDAEESVLRRVVQLFRLLYAKDKFGEYCQRLLARRLLSGKSRVTEFSENRFLMMIREECGQQFTARMISMMDDIRVSKELITQFKEFRRNTLSANASAQPSEVLAAFRQSASVDLNVFVLKTGSWPLNRSFPVNFTDFQPCIESFKAFYANLNRARKLSFAASYGTAKVDYNFKGRTLSLSLSTIQAAVVMLFNERDSWTFPEIHARIQVMLSELRGNMSCLHINKKERRFFDLLSFNKDRDLLSINDAFEPPRSGQISVNAIVQAESTALKKETDEKIQEQRNFEIDCAIVRIMKARKKLSHMELLKEVVQVLRMRFEPANEDIKRRISSLMDREFLSRAPDDPSVYVYDA